MGESEQHSYPLVSSKTPYIVPSEPAHAYIYEMKTVTIIPAGLPDFRAPLFPLDAPEVQPIPSIRGDGPCDIPGTSSRVESRRPAPPSPHKKDTLRYAILPPTRRDFVRSIHARIRRLLYDFFATSRCLSQLFRPRRDGCSMVQFLPLWPRTPLGKKRSSRNLVLHCRTT